MLSGSQIRYFQHGFLRLSSFLSTKSFRSRLPPPPPDYASSDCAAGLDISPIHFGGNRQRCLRYFFCNWVFSTQVPGCRIRRTSGLFLSLRPDYAFRRASPLTSVFYHLTHPIPWRCAQIFISYGITVKHDLLGATVSVRLVRR